MRVGFDFSRRRPVKPAPSPEVAQALAIAQSVAAGLAHEARKRGNDGALGLAQGAAYRAFHASLAKELGREWPPTPQNEEASA